jgi:hypothetical protein
MTKSKGIGRGGRREKAGRPRFAKTGKTSYFSTRITQKTRDLLEAEARLEGRSLSIVAEELLQLGLREKSDLRGRARPMRALYFLFDWLSDTMEKTDDNWRSNPYLFAAFHAAVSRVLHELKPPGKIIPPPPSETFQFPDAPEEHARECANVLLSYWRYCSISAERGHGPEAVGAKNFPVESEFRAWITHNYYGMADAHRDLSLKIQDNRRRA